MKGPGRAPWVLVAMNTVILVLALQCTLSAHVQSRSSPRQVEKWWFVPVERACGDAQGFEVFVALTRDCAWIESATPRLEGLVAQRTSMAQSENIASRFLPSLRAGICHIFPWFVTLRRPEIILHPFRAYPLPFPNEDVESPSTYRI